MWGHVPITDKNGRGREVIPMAPHEAQRYKIRSSAERANSRLKEDFSANNVMVGGHGKVTQHLMFEIISLFADRFLSLLGEVVKEQNGSFTLGGESFSFCKKLI